MTRLSIIKLSRIGLVLALASLCACSGNWRPSDAYIERLAVPACPHWSLDVVAPGYMEAWVEDLEVKDDRGFWVRIPKGVVGELDQTVGWAPLDRIGGFGVTIRSAGAPMEIFIRWQSLTEPQTYRWQFTVSEDMRQAMSTRERIVFLDKIQQSCRSGITIGVAPGGRTAVWISGRSLATVEIVRGQAEVEPLGPYRGLSNGKHRPMHEQAQAYIREHGIPYGSWDP